jgi:dienelactone hydrolase
MEQRRQDAVPGISPCRRLRGGQCRISLEQGRALSANVQDLKAAVRFLRAKEKEYGYRTDRIAIAGSSSGGHLAALVGTTNGVKELEGTVGDNLGESSAVQAVVSWYGASNFTTILAQSTPFGSMCASRR